MTTPIPQPKGVPLLGNIFDVDPSNTWVSLQKLWEKYGEIFKITVLGQQIVFVGSVALCEELCDQTRFRKYVGGPIVEIRYAVHDSLFTAFANETNWGLRHRILSPYLTSEGVAGHFSDTRQCTIELITKLTQTNSKVNLITELNRLDLETTTLCFYGRKLNGIVGPLHPMIGGMEGATSEAIKRPTRPKIINWLFYGSKFKTDTKIMRKYAADCVQYRKDNPTDRKDILYAIMNSKDPETEMSLNYQQIIDEIVELPIGSSTASCVVATAMYYLLKNPECIVKAREEIDSVIQGEFTRDHLDKLPYCTGIVRETMRLAAPAPGFNIEPLPETQDPVLLAGGKYLVPPKQTMIIVLHGVNRDPAVFQDPEAFRPERMIGDAWEKIPAGAKKWFGNGKRVCIGQHYAWNWNMITLVSLLKDVDLEMAEPGYKLKQDGWFNLRPVDFHVNAKPKAK